MDTTPTVSDDSPPPSGTPEDDDSPYEESVDLRKRSFGDWTLLNHAGNMRIYARHDKQLAQRVVNLFDIPTSLPSSLAPTTIVSGPLDSSTTTAAQKSPTSRVPAQAAAKTTKASCSPSPTTSMAPSASKSPIPSHWPESVIPSNSATDSPS